MPNRVVLVAENPAFPFPAGQPDPDPALSGAEAAAALATCLSQADPGAGLPAGQAAAAARRAVGLAAQLARPTDEARARAWLCSHLLRLGRHAEMLAEAPAALALLDLAVLGRERRELLRLMALAASETGAYDVALESAHELVRLSAGIDDDIAALQAAYSLAVCFERMGDSWQATRLLTQALADHGTGVVDLARLIVLNAVCAISIGLMHRLHGVDSEAEVQAMLARGRAAAEEARAMLALLPNVDYEVAVLGNLGEILLHQGELAAAEPLLRRSHEISQRNGLRAHTWRVRATLGHWLLASGRIDEALAEAQALIAEGADAMPPQTAIRAHDVAYRACRALGRFEQALAHFEALERSERRRATTQLRAQSQLLVTRAEAQHAQRQAEHSRLEAQSHRERAAHLAEAAERDPLTGLGNRRYFDRRSAELLSRAQAGGLPLALAMIDIDHFKTVNDAHGHAVGDAVLVELAQLLRENTRAADVLARFGGEEFVLLLPDLPLQQAQQFCDRLRERVAAYPWEQPEAPCLSVTISIGLAAAPAYEAAALLAAADAALYRAKRAGRNRTLAG